uniref:Galectin n=1 Tax=Laticauda laticaudata TaxID=8630 RepID=A0A8C5S4D4_LATLA
SSPYSQLPSPMPEGPGTDYLQPLIPSNFVNLYIFLSCSLCRFQVDFQCGSCEMPKSDVAFHFNTRFDENCIVCNSHEKGSWQQEERKYDMVFLLFVAYFSFDLVFIIYQFRSLVLHRATHQVSYPLWVLLTVSRWSLSIVVISCDRHNVGHHMIGPVFDAFFARFID